MSKGAGHAMCLLSKDNTGLSALRLCHTHRETSQPHRRLMHKSTRTYYTTCPKHKQCMMGRLTKTPHRSWVSATFIEKDSFRDHSLRARLFKKPCWRMEKNTDSPVKVQSYLMLLDSFPLAKNTVISIEETTHCKSLTYWDFVPIQICMLFFIQKDIQHTIMAVYFS